MYYLKSVDNKKIRFESIVDVFKYFEKWAALVKITPYPYNLRRFIGNDFKSSVKEVNEGFNKDLIFIDSRNPVCNIFDQRSSIVTKFLGYYSDSSVLKRRLVLDNKFVLFNSNGFIVDFDFLLTRYIDRYRSTKDSKFDISGNRYRSERGFRSSKNQIKRLNRRYEKKKPGKMSLVRSNPVDEWEKAFPERISISSTTKMLNEYEYYSERGFSRSWKDQSKKRNQWKSYE